MKTGLIAVGFVGLCAVIGWGAATGHGWFALGALTALSFALGFSAEHMFRK